MLNQVILNDSQVVSKALLFRMTIIAAFISLQLLFADAGLGIANDLPQAAIPGLRYF
jgi:hypothetical protein